MGALSRAAEGLDRRAFTVSEVLRMQYAGILSDDERYELIEGEIVLMAPKGARHDHIRSALSFHIARATPDCLWLGVATTLYLSDDTLLESDLIVFPREKAKDGPSGFDVRLAIEVATSSLAYDLGAKAQLYARHGVKEYWVVDAQARTTCQFTEPHGRNWRRRVEWGPNEPLTHPALPGFSIRLSDY